MSAPVHAVDRAFALGLLAMLLVYGLEKRRNGQWGELLFGCHVATAVLSLGLLLGAPWLVGSALVFHVGIGIPSWVAYAVARGTTRPLEVLAHVLPCVAAVPAAMRWGIPSGAALAAWGSFLALQVLSYFATAPALNVNLAHGPSPELARFVPGAWASRLVLAVMGLFMLLGSEWALVHLLKAGVSQ
jgi:hypothetical protein